MPDFIKQFFNTNFLPHGHCFFWQSDILWLHVLADSLIFVSYLSIPFALFYYLRKKNTFPFKKFIWLLVSFILLCGATHILNVWTTWSAQYLIEGWIKMATALFSIATAVYLYFIMPRILKFPTPQELKETQEKLDVTTQESQRKSDELDLLSKELSLINESMTGRENRIIELKKKVNELCQEAGKDPVYKIDTVIDNE